MTEAADLARLMSKPIGPNRRGRPTKKQQRDARRLVRDLLALEIETQRRASQNPRLESRVHAGAARLLRKLKRALVQL